MIFRSLGQLGDHLAARPSPPVTVLDPGLPIHDLAVHTAAEVWRTQPSVRKVIDFAARSVASIPMHLYERVGDDDRPRVHDHPLAVALRAPAPRVTPYRFWHSVLVDWMTFDRMAILKVPTIDDSLELVRLPARRVRFEGDALQRVQSVHVAMADGSPLELDPADVLFDAGYSVRGTNGTSPMETLADIISESSEAVAYRRSVWKNGGRVPVVIERPLDAPDWGGKGGGKERFVKDLRNYTRGGGAEGGWPILEDGMVAKPIQAFTPRDALDLEGRRLTDAEVASAFHIAPELVGARAGNYSNVAAFREALYGDALGPWITLRDELLNVQLVPDYAAAGRPLYVEANVDVKIRGSFETQAAVLSTSTGAPWLTRNEARGRMNLPRVDGGDDLVTPLNVTLGGLASPRDTAPKNRRPGGRKSAAPDDLADPDRETEVLTAELSDLFDRQARSVTSKLGAKAARKDVTDDGDAGPGDLSEAFDRERWDAELAAVIGPRIIRLADAGAWQVLEQYNPEADGWDAEVMTAWLLAAAATHATGINDGTEQRLTEAIASGEDWKTGVADAFAHLARNAAGFALSMRTEALGFGGHDAAGASGLTHKTWETRSSNPRSSHQRLNGETVLMSETFSNGARWPADSVALDVDDRANCKCIVKFHVEGE